MGKNLRRILLESDTRLMELLSGALLTLIGLWIISPFWDTFDAAKSYDLMRVLFSDPHLSEIAWGSLFVFAGGLKVISVTDHHHQLRTISRILSLFAWLYLSISFAISNILSTGTPVYALLAISNFYLIVWRGEK